MPTWLWTTFVQIIADPQFDAAHVARINRVYRIALPLYAIMTTATAASRAQSDPLMAALWILQACTAFGTYLGLLLRPARADRIMRIGFCFLFLGMLTRVPRAVIASGLRDVDVHAVTVGIVLALLAGQTVFAPRAAKRVNLACAMLTFAVLIGSLGWNDHVTVGHVLAALRLIAATAALVALLGFVNDTVHQYARLWEEHRLMQTLALCDPLTELPNRRACETTLRREIARSEREGKALSVLLLDVDHFKLINDRFGHEEGDRVLQHIAQLLRDNLRASDEPSRWAGDEFVAVLPATNLEHAHLVAERIRRAVASAELAHGPSKITVTLGVAQLVVGDDARSLLARADRNLYQAKNEGRNCSVAA